MIATGARVILFLSEPEDEKPIEGTVMGVVPGSEDRAPDKVVYFVRWDDDDHPEHDRRYRVELIVLPTSDPRRIK